MCEWEGDGLKNARNKDGDEFLGCSSFDLWTVSVQLSCVVMPSAEFSST